MTELGASVLAECVFVKVPVKDPSLRSRFKHLTLSHDLKLDQGNDTLRNYKKSNL